ncbi:MAG: sterol desaturase family protein [Chthoniobacter sp.]|uniref:sterol desaturase family protein n=1 Tax=Chthoniobacter sp. TaxID=2510640 RepID=UPI0032AD76F6
MTHQLLRHALGLMVDAGRLALWLVILVAIFVPLERLCALHPAKIWRKQIGVDLGWYFINSLVPAAFISVPLAMLSRSLAELNPGGYYSTVAAWPLWVKLLLTLVVNDLGAYWGHRAMHASPRLWRFHAIHHSAEELDWLVNTRAHPFDMVFTRLSGLAPVYLLGLAQTTGPHIDPVVAIVTIFGTAWTFFIHANIRVRLGPLEWLISSPAFHHWHHTNDQHRDRNFAFLFPLIDRIFGTAWLPKSWPSRYGIDAQVPTTLTGQFFDLIKQPSVGPATDRQHEEIKEPASIAKDHPSGV